jgi:hypothetical protein
MLISAGADPQLRDNLGLNAIEWAQRRGLSEAHAILTKSPQSVIRPKRIVIPVEGHEEPVAEPPPNLSTNEIKENVGDDEKSRRWLAGLKQRLDEQATRRLNSNESPLESPSDREASPQPPSPIKPGEQEVQVVDTNIASEPERPKAPTFTSAPRILTPLPATTGKRKRCPQCNAIYNGDLLAYCAHHIVPLVDADEPIITEKPKSSAPLFWILLIITLTGSIIAASLATTYLYKSNQPSTQTAAEQPKTVQKGTPEVGAELAGKAVSLPKAECPLRGSEPVSGTVTVWILVDKNGQVYRARGSGGDWLMRGAATEAAMKSTFAKEKLRGRETEGTITYTFKP